MAIKTFAVNLTNMQAVDARNAIQMIGQTNGKNREMALKLARIGLILDAKVRMYEAARRNLIRSNTVTDEQGNVVYQDEYQQQPRTRWDLQWELSALDGDVICMRSEKLTVDELGEVSSNVLLALAPLVIDLAQAEEPPTDNN